MPKKTIMDNPGDQPFRPAVGWTPDLDVQLGLQVWNSDLHIADHLYGRDLQRSPEHRDEQLKKLGGLLAARLDLRSSPGDAELGQLALDALREVRADIERDGIWVSLTRHAINDLVRALRKARDSAYGVDA